MRLKTIIKALVAGLVVCIALLALLFGFLFWLNGGPKRPTDASLVRQFESNSVAFVEMKQMLLVDQQIRDVFNGGIRNTNDLVATASLATAGISEDRYQRYLTLLKQTGAWSAGRNSDITELRFPVAKWGAFSDGWRIAIVWTTNEPKPLVANLDDFKKTTHEWQQAYRPLGDGWYLWIIW
jgi:hypothetical protein